MKWSEEFWLAYVMIQYKKTYKHNILIILMTDKWYHSEFARYLGIGLGIGVGFLGLSIGMNYNGTTEKVETVPVLQEADINGDGVPDKFYVIGGKISVIELDGKSISKSLEEKILEKEE